MLILSIVKSLALGIWIGALLMLGYAVAGPIFKGSSSKTLAGNINAVILSRMNNIEWICAIVALLSALMLLWMNWPLASNGLRIAECVLIAVAAILLYSYAGPTTSRMNDLRASIKDFDQPMTTTEYVSAKAEFDSLHHRYTSLVGANMLVILTSFVLSAMNSRPSTP